MKIQNKTKHTNLKHRITFCILSLPLLLTACLGPATATPTRTPVPRGELWTEKTPLPETREDCEHAGGSWEQLGLIGMGCNMPTTDAGQPCQDTKQCQGFCLAADPKTIQTDSSGFQSPDHNYIERVNQSSEDLAGECAAWVSTFGCSVIIESGRYGVICVD